MRKHGRFLYQTVLPLGRNGRTVTGCKAHQAIAAQAAAEGTVLLKNDGTLPLATGAKICLFGTGAGEFLFGGGGSGYVCTSRLASLHQGLEEAPGVVTKPEMGQGLGVGYPGGQQCGAFPPHSAEA